MSVCRLRCTYTTLTIIREGVYQIYYNRERIPKPTIREDIYQTYYNREDVYQTYYKLE